MAFTPEQNADILATIAHDRLLIDAAKAKGLTTAQKTWSDKYVAILDAAEITAKITPLPPPPPPPPSTWPGATNTGIPSGMTLATVPGGSYVIDAGVKATLPVIDGLAVFEKKIVSGTLQVDVPGVWVRYCRVKGNPYYGLWSPANFTRVTQSDLGPDTGGVDNALSFENDSEAYANNVHNGRVGIKFRSRCKLGGAVIPGLTLQGGNWVHDIYQGPGDHNGGIHAPQGDSTYIGFNFIDGLTVPSGGRNHNGISIYDELTGTSTGLMVERNKITHSGYHVYLAVKSATVRDNVLTTDFQWGPFFNAQSGTAYTGNVDENGAPWSLATSPFAIQPSAEAIEASRHLALATLRRMALPRSAIMAA